MHGRTPVEAGPKRDASPVWPTAIAISSHKRCFQLPETRQAIRVIVSEKNMLGFWAVIATKKHCHENDAATRMAWEAAPAMSLLVVVFDLFNNPSRLQRSSCQR
jgi:hypothetical protein